jgi:hypothetical protein
MSKGTRTFKSEMFVCVLFAIFTLLILDAAISYPVKPISLVVLTYAHELIHAMGFVH